MAGQDPVNDQLPTSDGGYQTYKAAGKLAGRKALITGGDSGIGRAVAILYAMEGAESTIVYTSEGGKGRTRHTEIGQRKGTAATIATSRPKECTSMQRRG